MTNTPAAETEAAEPYRSRYAPHTVIDDDRALAAAAERLAGGTGPVAVDAERASGFRYSQRAYLLQFFRRGSGVVLIDPTAFDSLALIQNAIADAEWVFHAASQDLDCVRDEGLEPPRIFDTELTARLLGHERVGLGAVAEHTLGISLAKEFSAVDWSTRPLPAEWLEYAALDVEILIDVRDALEKELEEQGKVDIAAQEFEATRLKPRKEPRDEPWRRLSGIHAIRNPRSLAIARELWLARDELARQRDTAPGRLVPDRALVALVQARPSSKRDVHAMRQFTGPASRTEIDRWWRAYQKGLATEALPGRAKKTDALPPPRAWKEKRPDAHERLSLAKPALDELATDLGVPLENLLLPDTLRRISWDAPATMDEKTIADELAGYGARPWQISYVAPILARVFVEARQAVADATDADS